MEGKVENYGKLQQFREDHKCLFWVTAIVFMFFGIFTLLASFYIIWDMDLEMRPGCYWTDFFVGVSAVLFALKVAHALNMLFEYDFFNDWWDSFLQWSMIFHCCTFMIMGRSCIGDSWFHIWFMALLIINILCSILIMVAIVVFKCVAKNDPVPEEEEEHVERETYSINRQFTQDE